MLELFNDGPVLDSKLTTKRGVECVRVIVHSVIITMTHSLPPCLWWERSCSIVSNAFIKRRDTYGEELGQKPA
jgi:hypothetical protein